MNTKTKSAMQLECGDVMTTRVWQIHTDDTGKIFTTESFVDVQIESVTPYLIGSKIGVDVAMKIQTTGEIIIDSFGENTTIEIHN